jgi:hypothetical protein
MELEFDGELFVWTGPAPWFFIAVPNEHCPQLADESEFVSYGWGMIPVTVEIGGSRWETSLFPQDDGYLLPIKAAVRRAERLDEGDHATVHMTVRADR